MSCICITIDSPVHNPNEGIFMAANIILLVILIFFLIVIAIFSLNLNIVVSFYASTEDEKLYQYAISLRNSATIKILSFELLRITSNNPQKRNLRKKNAKSRMSGKKSNQISSVINHLLKFTIFPMSGRFPLELPTIRRWQPEC